ncbi:endonuclease/exonuclease/phosphatase family protein [Actinoplanes sp. NPDC026619]|uniref:endonuclease/exonuclease/phosphatase family protein n=1 Tax=Actinoplanes sp. NPDC026619 TaxID=3155798 RepID=UPI0033EBA3F7
MRIRVAAQNMQHDATADEAGRPEDRWPLLVQRLQRIEPDILLLSEVRGWAAHGHRQLCVAQRELGMYAMPIPHSNSGNPTVIMFRPDTMGMPMYYNNDLSAQTLHGFATASFTVANDLPPMTFAAVHLSPYSVHTAVAEADLIATRAYRHGPLAIVAGDANFAPHAGPDPDYQAMRPYNLAARTYVDSDGRRHPRREVAQAFVDRDYVDVAWRLCEQTGDDALLRRTASDDRIDRIYCSGATADAWSNHQRLDSPARASDHDGVAADVDTDTISRAGLWTYR